MKEVPVHNWCDTPESNVDDNKCRDLGCEWIDFDGATSC